MTKAMLILFTGLTLGAAYLTYHNVGVADASASNNRSVRIGSAGHSINYSGGK
jgi:hypothetical protein